MNTNVICYNIWDINPEDNDMRVVCPHCDSKALITSSNELSKTVKDLYCTCTNAQTCGASFVYTLAYKHILNPPQQTMQQMAATVLNQLPAEQRNALLQGDLFNEHHRTSPRV